MAPMAIRADEVEQAPCLETRFILGVARGRAWFRRESEPEGRMTLLLSLLAILAVQPAPPIASHRGRDRADQVAGARS